eukprot:scaffold5.g794.t1
MGLRLSTAQEEQDPSAGHQSWNSNVPTTVVFHNASPYTVRMVWLTHSGLRKPYMVLRPGQHYRQPTFTAHPWIAEALSCASDAAAGAGASGSALLEAAPVPGVVLVAGENHQRVFYPAPKAAGARTPVVAIRECSLVAWSPDSHAAFPAPFRALVATLLLVHRRAQRIQPGGTSSSGGSCEDGVSRTAVAGATRSAGGLSTARRVLRQLDCCAKAARRTFASDAVSGPHEVGELPQAAALGSLPHELVLAIIAAAVPPVPLLRKPPLPHGMEAGTLAEAHAALFAA